VVVSDIHLLEEGDARGQKLLQLIARLDSESVQYFALLGDIFDFCFGASPYFQRKYAKIGEALCRLAQQGVKVIFIQGNHEFSLIELPWPGVELLHGLGKTIRVDETAIALTHGDLLSAPWHYRWYRAIARSRLFKGAGLLVPPRFLDNLALGISRKSRKRGVTRRIDHQRVIAKIRSWYTAQQCAHGVVGHFHIPYHLQEAEGVILCMESWDKPNYLGFRDGVFTRNYL
jgi:UDP-2,3-diacylglucosamine pyrophosphatase LpxH